MRKKIATLFLSMLCIGLIHAQEQGVLPDTVGINIINKNFVYVAKKMTGEITLDGVLDEDDWQNAQLADNFRMVTPVDTGFPKQPSVAMITYDDHAIYIGAIFYDTIPGNRVVESFRRDFGFNTNDNLITIFDTFRDQTNAFAFGSNPAGAIWDGLITGSPRTNLDWDSKVEVEVMNYPDRWTTEIRVPFRSIRYPSGSRVWYTNFGRFDARANEKSVWAPVPRQYPHSSPAFTGVLIFDNPLPDPKVNFSLIPYAIGGYSRNYEAGTDANYTGNVGLDAKISFSTSSNFDLTINPDFAQVDVDQQQLNVDRFELFFPEKRQFFLENQDLFNYGDRGLNPFFSRRIGLDASVLGGARFTGKIGNDFRLGAMHMITEKTNDMPIRNYSVISMQQRVFARSNISLMFVNQEHSGSDHYNRVAALDFNMASRDNVWNGKLFYHRSFQPGNPDKQFAQGASIEYRKNNFDIELNQTAVGENYFAETGFVRRTNYIEITPEFRYQFVPNKFVATHGPFGEVQTLYNMDFERMDQTIELGYSVNFRDNSSIRAGVNNEVVLLDRDFDPTRLGGDGVFLPAGNEYRYKQLFVNAITSTNNPFNGSLSYTKGGFFNGDIDIVTANLNYRFQPYVNLSINTVYTNIRLPQPFQHTDFWLIGPKLDITFSPKLYLTTFVQYNEQENNANINVRFQWRYKPVSDIFLVYTDNYYADTREVRNRALVLKFTYWWN